MWYIKPSISRKMDGQQNNLRFRAGKGIKAALAEAKFRPAEDLLSKKK